MSRTLKAKQAQPAGMGADSAGLLLRPGRRLLAVLSKLSSRRFIPRRCPLWNRLRIMTT